LRKKKSGRERVPSPPVFFVRVAGKGLSAERLKIRNSGLMGKRQEGVPPPVFYKRVRKLLIGKEMWEYSF
jgi:hypothetical protein